MAFDFFDSRINMKKILLVIMMVAAGYVSAQDSVTNPLGSNLADGALLERLQSGSLVIVFRHGATGPDSDHPDPISGRKSYPGSLQERQAGYFDCERQRILSEKGRDDMRQIAAAIREIGMVIGAVVASPMCRTRESAWLLVGQVKPEDALIGPENDERDRLATTVPAVGSNRILVSHSYVVAGIISTPDQTIDGEFVSRGHCLVLDPDGKGGFDFLAKLGPDDWTRLAALNETNPGH
jgi:hypothetical protein